MNNNKECVTYGITNKLMFKKSFGRYDILSGVMTATRKEASESINTKISMKDHLPKISSQRNTVSLLPTLHNVGGINHSTNTANCFIYGQAPENTRINIASSFAPAVHISTTLFVEKIIW